MSVYHEIDLDIGVEKLKHPNLRGKRRILIG